MQSSRKLSLDLIYLHSSPTFIVKLTETTASYSKRTGVLEKNNGLYECYNFYAEPISRRDGRPQCIRRRAIDDNVGLLIIRLSMLPILY